MYVDEPQPTTQGPTRGADAYLAELLLRPTNGVNVILFVTVWFGTAHVATTLEGRVILMTHLLPSTFAGSSMTAAMRNAYGNIADAPFRSASASSLTNLSETTTSNFFVPRQFGAAQPQQQQQAPQAFDNAVDLLSDDDADDDAATS